VPPEDPAAPADQQDTFIQAREIRQCLRQLGHEDSTLVYGTDPKQTERDLLAAQADCLVNLVEDPPEGPDQQYRVAACLDRLGLPYTGAHAAALKTLGDKRAMKGALRLAGLPTPDDLFLPPPCGEGGGSRVGVATGTARVAPPPDPYGATLPTRGREKATYIVKSAIEHASIGIDARSVVRGEDAARKTLAEKRAGGGTWFAERFIDGREFNVAILDTRTGPQVLPLAEILFLDHAHRPKIVGYAEKWAADSAAYASTPRHFPTDAADAPLLAELQRLALAAWDAFGLTGYARVDFRVDVGGTPYILEVNANPCLAADAGFCAAAQRAGLTQTDIVAHLIETALA
jgi:D-alanine-D-alanine ligase